MIPLLTRRGSFFVARLSEKGAKEEEIRYNGGGRERRR